jgi:hypothetical protein
MMNKFLAALSGLHLACSWMGESLESLHLVRVCWLPVNFAHHKSWCYCATVFFKVCLLSATQHHYWFFLLLPERQQKLKKGVFHHHFEHEKLEDRFLLLLKH